MRLHFMNRTREIARLTRVLVSPDPSLVVIYGRRRCGKSTLLQHIAKKTDIYFLADQQEAPLQIQSLAVEIGRTIPGFEQVNYPSWEVLFFYGGGKMNSPTWSRSPRSSQASSRN